MFNYTQGKGHIDLANRLGIAQSIGIEVPGSANTRILRTTLKHSYQTDKPTFYVLGMTFVSRGEIPILKVPDELTFEGRWTNPQNQDFENRWEHFWGRKQTEDWVDLKRKTEVYSLLDRTEDLMYSMLAVIDSLKSRGHQVLMYQQADQDYWFLKDHPKFALLKNNPHILNGFMWSAMQYQHDAGVPKMEVDPSLPQSMLPTPFSPQTPVNQLKPAIGQHSVLNEFLVKYITDNNLL
jgi:hypothetical protein